MINQIYLANCFDLLPEIPAESIDLILTDPPFQKTYSKAKKYLMSLNGQA